MQDVTVKAKVFSRPELLMGEPTGRTQWVCEPIPPFTPFSAVLGRAGTREGAIADWKFRASYESYAKNYNVDLVVEEGK